MHAHQVSRDASRLWHETSASDQSNRPLTERGQRAQRDPRQGLGGRGRSILRLIGAKHPLQGFGGSGRICDFLDCALAPLANMPAVRTHTKIKDRLANIAVSDVLHEPQVRQLALIRRLPSEYLGLD